MGKASDGSLSVASRRRGRETGAASNGERERDGNRPVFDREREEFPCYRKEQRKASRGFRKMV